MKPAMLAEQIMATLLNKKTEFLNIIIKGGPGVGKSEIMSQIAKTLGWDILVMHPQISDPTKFDGLPWISAGKDKAITLPFAELKAMIDATEPLLVFMDDMIQAPPAVQAAVMQLIQARQVNTHKVSKFVHFVAATNRENDKAGGTAILEPLKSRYIIWEMEPDVNDWCQWAQKPENGVPPALVGFIRMKPSMLYQFEPSKKIENYPCPRTIYNLGLLMQREIKNSLKVEIYQGVVGREFAVELAAFMKIRDELPHPDSILADPMSADIPTDTAILYALCSLLAERAIYADKREAIINYARRLSDKMEFEKIGISFPRSEFSIFLVKSAIMISDKIQETDAFVEWASDNQELLFYE